MKIFSEKFSVEEMRDLMSTNKSSPKTQTEIGVILYIFSKETKNQNYKNCKVR